MADSIQVLAADSDYRALRAFIGSSGLLLLPMRIDDPDIDNDHDRLNHPGCYISQLPLEQLHPYGNPPVQIADVIDPLIFFIRPYHVPPHLTAGSLILNTDAPEVSQKIRAQFERLRRWIRRNWKHRKEWSCYVGPEADHLLNTGAAIYRSPLEGVPVNQVQVRTKK